LPALQGQRSAQGSTPSPRQVFTTPPDQLVGLPNGHPPGDEIIRPTSVALEKSAATALLQPLRGGSLMPPRSVLGSKSRHRSRQSSWCGTSKRAVSLPCPWILGGVQLAGVCVLLEEGFLCGILSLEVCAHKRNSPMLEVSHGIAIRLMESSDHRPLDDGLRTRRPESFAGRSMSAPGSTLPGSSSGGIRRYWMTAGGAGLWSGEEV